MALHCHSKWGDLLTHVRITSSHIIPFPFRAHSPLTPAPSAWSWPGWATLWNRIHPYNTSLAAYLSQYRSIPAALASILWAGNPIKAVPGPRPPSNCVRLGAPCSTAPSYDPGLAIVVAPSAPRSALPGSPAATHRLGCGSRRPTVLKHSIWIPGTPVTHTAPENGVPGLGTFTGFWLPASFLCIVV
jgi:hypothetical protein